MSSDFALTVEKTCIWAFSLCYLVCAASMAPEVIYGATENTLRYSVFASTSLLTASICWAVVQTLWVVAMKLLVKEGPAPFIALKASPHTYRGD